MSEHQLLVLKFHRSNMLVSDEVKAVPVPDFCKLLADIDLPNLGSLNSEIREYEYSIDALLKMYSQNELTEKDIYLLNEIQN